MPDLGYYTVPVIASFEGIDKQVNDTLGKAFGDGGKKAGKALGEGLKSSEADVKKAIESYSKLRDKAEDSLGKVRTAEAALQALRDKGAANERIVAAEEKLATARRNSTRAVDDAKRSYNEYESAQKSLGDGVGKTVGLFDGFASKAGDAGKAIGALSIVAASAAVVGIGALAAGVAVAGSKLYELGAQFDDLSDNLRIKTGATGESLDSLKTSVENLGTTNVPLSLGEIGDVAAEVTRNLHLTGPELESVTSRLANLGRMGQQVDVRGLGKAFRAFGVDASSQSAALDSLYEASTKSGLQVNDLVASVTKGGPALKALGFNFGQSAALVTTFEDAGIDADKAIAGLTKSAAAFAKDGKAAPEALRDTVTEIKRLVDAGDEVGAQNLSNKVFGAKGGVGFFDAIKSGNLDLQSLSDSLQTTGLDINDVSTETGDWAETWEILKNKLAVALEPIASGVFDTVNGKLTELSTWVEGHQDQVIDFFAAVATGALTAVDAILSFTADGLRALGQFFESIAPQLKNLGDQLSVLGGVLKYVPGFQDMGRAIQAVGDASSGFGQSIDSWNGPLNTAANYVDNLRNGIPALKDKVGEYADQAKAAADNTATLGDSITTLINMQDPQVKVNVSAVPGAGVALNAAGDITIPIATALAGGPQPPGSGTPGLNPLTVPSTGGHAAGGVLPGYSETDNLLVPMAGGEGVIRSRVMKKLGSAWLARLNAGYAQGGVVGSGPDVVAAQNLVGTPYSQGNRTDCSGMVARVIDRTLGLPESGLMSTKTARDWLAARGFQPGTGGPGQISVGWYDHGPNPNDGHMAMTLSDGTNAEAGGSHGEFLVGDGAKGANDPQFDQHMFLPTLFGEGAGSGGASSPFGSSATSGGGTFTPPDAKTLREANQKVADADTRVQQAEQKQKELKADAKQSEKDKAQADVDKAKREAADAKSDLAEVQKGKFTPGKSGSGSGGGTSQFGELGSIAGSFFKETLGIDGSFLPDLSSLGIVQGAGNLLTAFKGPLQGLVDGGLGIQQPGWSPGMPVNGVAAPTTSLSPFGLSATQMPGLPDAQHAGSGALPGPVSIDNSTTINSPTGDPNDIENRIRRTNMNRPRIESYTLPGT